MDGVFDRSAEVEKYLPIVNEGARGVLLPLTKDIYVSGISDPRLAAAVNERLLRDYPTLSGRERTDTQYGAWLIKALASFGSDDYKTTCAQIRKKSKVGKLLSACSDELDNLGWHRTKNEIMSSRKNYTEGENPRVAQFQNLLQADDFSYKYLAAERMSWEKVLDPKLMDEIAAQIPRYMNETARASHAESNAIGMYCKVLGYSENPKYREVLQQVVDAKGAGQLVKKHAQQALDRLQ